MPEIVGGPVAVSYTHLEPEASVLDGLRVGDTSDIAGWLEEVLP